MKKGFSWSAVAKGLDGEDGSSAKKNKEEGEGVEGVTKGVEDVKV